MAIFFIYSLGAALPLAHVCVQQCSRLVLQLAVFYGGSCFGVLCHCKVVLCSCLCVCPAVYLGGPWDIVLSCLWLLHVAWG